jgi:hypothetical protein
MIYLTTFFLTLILTHVARAVPRGCHDLISPETETEQHGFTYGDIQPVRIPSPLKVTYDQTFDNRDGSTSNVACSNGPNGLASRYPWFGNFSSFPYIGGAYDIVWNSTNCGSCWLIYNPANGAWVYITGIDTAGSGFNIAKQAFQKLGNVDAGSLVVEAWKISNHPC